MGLFSKFKSIFSGADDSDKYTGIINAKEGKIVALEKEIANLKARDEQIVLLQKELSNLKGATSKGNATIKAKEDRIAGLERTVATLKEKLEAAKSEVKVEPTPVPKVEPKTEPPKPQAPIAKAPSKPPVAKAPVVVNTATQSKARTDDPYQQLGQDLVEALKKTTKRGDDSGESG